MKSKSIFVCKECGAQSPRWQGKCHACGAWDSFSESVSTTKSAAIPRISENKVLRLQDLVADKEYRIKTNISEFDRVLGGGIVPGSLILIGGDPGIGKSTLMLQMCRGLSASSILYVSGEESLSQIKIRSTRLKDIPGSLQLLAETNIEVIIQSVIMSKSKIVIIDSIQSVYTDKADASPGSVLQVRESTAALMQMAKKNNIAVFIIGHVTKDGTIAGPKLLEHTVDTVIQFEGDKTYSYRILRALKNRFGSTNEIGIFEMAEDGLTEVSNPSEMFIAGRNKNDSGIAIVAALEGTRPILLEVQALVTPTGYAVPQRTTTGFDFKRLNMILAVMEKRLGIKFRQHDVFLNIAGGLYINDPSVDLGIAAALMSSVKEQPIPGDLVLVGEIGLTGEVRPISFIEQRINEAHKLGFDSIMFPGLNKKNIIKKTNINFIPVDRISLAFSNIW